MIHIAQRASNVLNVHPVPGQTVAVDKYSGVEIAENDLIVRMKMDTWEVSPGTQEVSYTNEVWHWIPLSSSHEDDKVNNV